MFDLWKGFMEYIYLQTVWNLYALKKKHVYTKIYRLTYIKKTVLTFRMFKRCCVAPMIGGILIWGIHFSGERETTDCCSIYILVKPLTDFRQKTWESSSFVGTATACPGELSPACFHETLKACRSSRGSYAALLEEHRF